MPGPKKEDKKARIASSIQSENKKQIKKNRDILQ